MADASLFARFLEWRSARRNPSYQRFRRARMLHEAYMKENRIDTESITPQQRLLARSSPVLKEVERLYGEAVDVVPETDDRSRAVVHEQFGLLHYMRGDFDKARVEYSYALNVYLRMPGQAARERVASSNCYYFLSLIALDLQDRPTAREHILKALEIDQQLGNPFKASQDRRVLSRCDSTDE